MKNVKPKNKITAALIAANMKSVFLTIEEAIKAGNDGQNQDIKAQFVGREVFCNVNSLVEYCLKMGFEDRDSPVNYDDLENFYHYPEWAKRVLDRDLYFEGGQESDRDTFLEVFDEMEEDSDSLLNDGHISEGTHESNISAINEARREVQDLEQEQSEVFEWWAVGSMLFEDLKKQGQVVIDTGSVHVWGRCTTGQAILLDGVITRICAEMGILEGQPNSWAKKPG